MEAIVKETHTLWSTRGVVHMEGVDYDGKQVYIELPARELLDDLMSLYRCCKQAIKEENDHTHEQSLNLIEELERDTKDYVRTGT